MAQATSVRIPAPSAAALRGRIESAIASVPEQEGEWALADLERSLQDRDSSTGDTTVWIVSALRGEPVEPLDGLEAEDAEAIREGLALLSKRLSDVPTLDASTVLARFFSGDEAAGSSVWAGDVEAPSRSSWWSRLPIPNPFQKAPPKFQATPSSTIQTDHVPRALESLARADQMPPRLRKLVREVAKAQGEFDIDPERVFMISDKEILEKLDVHPGARGATRRLRRPFHRGETVIVLRDGPWGERRFVERLLYEARLASDQKVLELPKDNSLRHWLVRGLARHQIRGTLKRVFEDLDLGEPFSRGEVYDNEMALVAAIEARLHGQDGRRFWWMGFRKTNAQDVLDSVLERGSLQGLRNAFGPDWAWLEALGELEDLTETSHRIRALKWAKDFVENGGTTESIADWMRKEFAPEIGDSAVESVLSRVEEDRQGGWSSFRVRSLRRLARWSLRNLHFIFTANSSRSSIAWGAVYATFFSFMFTFFAQWILLLLPQRYLPFNRAVAIGMTGVLGFLSVLPYAVSYQAGFFLLGNFHFLEFSEVVALIKTIGAAFGEALLSWDGTELLAILAKELPILTVGGIAAGTLFSIPTWFFFYWLASKDIRPRTVKFEEDVVHDVPDGEKKSP